MPRDPMRALDDVTPPDLWDEIVARAAEGDVPVGHPGRRRPVLAVAAAVLVLAAVAGGVALANRGGDADRDPSVEGPTAQEPSIWGREWDLFGLVVDGQPTGVPPIGTGTDGARPAGSVVYLDLTTEGTVGFTGCNGGGTQAVLVDGRLVADDDWLSEAADCSDGDGGDFGGFGDDLMALDETMAELIQADPVVTLDGNQLTLTAGDTSARFFDPEARPPHPAEGDELVPSQGSTCVVGIRGGQDRGWRLTPGGPRAPDDLRPAGRTDVRSGLWEVTDGELIAEIQVPGQPVIDLTGERVEEVVLDDWGPATVWFRRGSVQVRAFPGLDDSGPCDAFTVAVAGPDEAANQAFAVAVADRMLAAHR